MQSSEELRETLVTLQRDVDWLRTEAAHAGLLLRALDQLLQTGADADPFSGVFDSLRDLFGFAQAMVLAEDGDDRLDCVVAQPPALAGIRWTSGPFFKRVMAGRVSATFSNHDLAEWRNLPPGSISPAQPALYLPIRVRDRRGILILLRAEGGEAFDRNHVVLGRKFALLASHALAARDARQTEAESRRLRELTEQLRVSERNAQRNADLLNEIVGLLPVGLTVEDEAGRLVLVNAAAASILGRSTELAAATPAPGRTSVTGTLHLSDAGTVAPSQVSFLEEKISTAEGERTFLKSQKPVRIFDETLLLSTSLDITARKQVENELARRAYFDDLTGLPNRALIQQQVETVMHRDGAQCRFALAFIDLDHFKQINDYYSHAIGDALLVAVSRRIASVVRPTDMLARISGDEFVLLFNPLQAESELRATIDGILDALKRPFEIDGYEIFTSASIGVGRYPEHGATYEVLRRSADSAMYRAKSGSKGFAAFYDVSMSEAVSARMELEQRLRSAIRDCSFRCAFQPKVDIRTGEVVGFEALVRWTDERGIVHAPGDFIAVAVDLGLIDQIATSVLTEAIAALPALDRQFGDHTIISINVAARQAGDIKFMSAFAQTLGATGCAHRFMLELTEDAFVATSLFQTQVLPILRQIGVRVSIDDFGTGYSSLAALADITVDEIKVDRSFITAIHQRPRSQGVLKAIESLSDALGMAVVAEGVETHEELAFLQATTRIRVAQGYYFAKPMFVDDLIRANLQRRLRPPRIGGEGVAAIAPDLRVA